MPSVLPVCMVHDGTLARGVPPLGAIQSAGRGLQWATGRPAGAAEE